jgi:glucose 1-dehydrogenase
MENNGRLRGKVAFVTGGDTGIGKAICLAMAREGACVVVDYHGDRAPADALVRQIEEFGGNAYALGADVAKPDDVQQLVNGTVERYGRLDIAVNNAGIEEQHPFAEMPLEVYEKTIAVDVTGVWLCTQAAVKQMIAQNQGGRVINISSVHEEISMPTNAAYCAAKGALRMLTRTLCVELAAHNITINNICPGAIDTPLDKPIKRNPQEIKALLDEIPLRRLGTPDEVAHMAVYLASDEAAYVTGASLFIDGGMSKRSGSL